MLFRSRKVSLYKISLFISSRRCCFTFCHSKKTFPVFHSWEKVYLSDLRDLSTVVTAAFKVKILKKPLGFPVNKMFLL